MIDRKLHKGDVVSVRAVVKHDQDPADGYVHVRIGGEFKPTVTVDVENIISFIQPRVEDGDKVFLSDDHEQRGTVRAVTESNGTTFLTVERAPGRIVVWCATNVEVDPEPQVRAEPAPPPVADAG
ncbi:MAG TPA: hypothetical protein VIU44_05310 [Gaiellaceae bacterium]